VVNAMFFVVEDKQQGCTYAVRIKKPSLKGFVPENTKLSNQVMEDFIEFAKPDHLNF